MSVTVKGTKTVRADPETIWAALDDVDRLALCIPGCRSLTRLSPNMFRLVVLVRLGPVRVEFHGTVERTVSDPPYALALVGRGEGGLAGMAAGSARITLTQVSGGCRIGYRIASEPTGPLAALGSFFLIGLAKGLIDAFIATLTDLLRGERVSASARAADWL